MKLIALAAATAALLMAPVAQADLFTPEEIDFINDVKAIGIINTEGTAGIVNGGWTICAILDKGFSHEWVAEQLYIGSQESNGSAGMEYTTAQAVVFYANADLCPEVTP